MKPYSKRLLTAFALLGLAAALPSQAVEIPISDYSLVPNGLNEATTFQNTNVNTPNGGVGSASHWNASGLCHFHVHLRHRLGRAPAMAVFGE